MVKLPSAKVYSKSVSVSYPGQSPKCVKVTTLGPRTLVFAKRINQGKALHTVILKIRWAKLFSLDLRFVCELYSLRLLFLTS